jgi:recombination protein RecR
MSKDLLYELIEALTILPGVGKKSAQRMALFLLDKNKDGALHLAKTLEECPRCHPAMRGMQAINI